jgi:hypothetical protein
MCDALIGLTCLQGISPFYRRKINAFCFILSQLKKILNYSEKIFFYIFSDVQAAIVCTKTLI